MVLQKGPYGPLRYLILTTSRAHPTKNGSAEEFLAVCPNPPFHHWLDGAGRASRVRPTSDFVVPDGVDRGPAAVEICRQAEVACLGGLFWCARTQTHGTNPLPMALQNLKRFVDLWCAENGRSAQISVAGVWELGAEAYAAEGLVDFVRSLRGEPELYAPNNLALVHGPQLISVDEQRAALGALGFAVAKDDVNSRWMVEDQQALLSFQREKHLRVSGWWDPLTKAAVREALRGQ